ncbi:MAG: hypothetical protein ACI8UO_005881 [Verrucomicrobiales bacterium]|jgi:hypothetical protein
MAEDRIAIPAQIPEGDLPLGPTQRQRRFDHAVVERSLKERVAQKDYAVAVV